MAELRQQLAAERRHNQALHQSLLALQLQAASAAPLIGLPARAVTAVGMRRGDELPAEGTVLSELRSVHASDSQVAIDADEVASTGTGSQSDATGSAPSWASAGAARSTSSIATMHSAGTHGVEGFNRRARGTEAGARPEQPPREKSTHIPLSADAVAPAAGDSSEGDGSQSEVGLPPIPGGVMRLERLRPTHDEHVFLNSFFGYIVRNFPVIDRTTFYEALERQSVKDGADTTVTVDADSVKQRL